MLHGLVAYPVSYKTLSEWIADAVQSGCVKAKTIENYLIGIKNRHIEDGLPTDVFADPRIKRLLLGALRLFGTTPIRPRGEIERPLLLAMVKSLDTNNHDDVNLKAAFTVAFAAFLRPGEFTWDAWDEFSPQQCLSRQSVSFLPDGSVILHLPQSKTDPFGQGFPIPLAPADDDACPVSALRTLLSRYPRTPSHPLFSRNFGPFSSLYLETSVKRAVLAAGHDPSTFSGHSF